MPGKTILLVILLYTISNLIIHVHVLYTVIHCSNPIVVILLVVHCTHFVHYYLQFYTVV